MKIIDFHQHIFLRENKWTDNDPDGDILARGMDQHGVEYAVVHAWPTSTYAQVGDNEDVLRAIRKHPDRLFGSVYINPRDATRSHETLKRYHGEGFRCVKMAPFIEGVYVDDPACWPVWEKINELGLPVMLHMGMTNAWVVPTGVKTPVDHKCEHPLYLVNVASHFPETKLVIAHLAGGWFWDALMLHQNFNNVFLDVACSSTFAHEFILEYEQRGPKDRARMFRLDNHVMFGLDLSPRHYEEWIGYWKRFVEAAGNPQFMDPFFYKTAAGLLGLKTE